MFRTGAQGAWFDPSDLTTLFQDSAGTAPTTAPGDPVGRILDKSGRDNHATQAVKANRPIYQVDGQGRGYLAFNGVNSGLTVAAFPAGSDKMQAFVGIRKLSDTAIAILTEFGVSLPPGSFYITAPHDGGFDIGTSVRAGINFGYSNASLDAPASAVIGMRADIATNDVRLRANGMQVASSSANLGGGMFGTWPLDIGRRGNGSVPFNGNIFGLILRFGAWSGASETARIENWLAQRAGVTL